MEKLFILRHFMIALLLIASSALAVPNESSEIASNNSEVNHDIQNENLTVAPLLVHTKDGDAVTAVAAEATPQDPNALVIIREALNNIEEHSQKKAKNRGLAVNTLLKLTPENMTFFIGTGLVTFNSIWLKSHGDPLEMERHIQSLKDPIAWISFYAFMYANGFYIDFKTKSMDPFTKMQMMKRLSYQGMAIGSLASSFVSDLGQSGKLCIDHWILGHNDQQSVEVCNEAWKSWTARNKFQQYFPQIISMWAAQAGAEFFTKKIVGVPLQIFENTSLVQNFINKESVIKFAKKITAIDIGLVALGGGTWTIRSIKFLGSLTQISAFLAVDHVLSPFIYAPQNDLIRPALFDFDALAINNFMLAADKINWDDNRIAEGSKNVCTVRNPNCLETKVISEIENFSQQMQQWREHLNSDAETDIAGWMELTKKLLNQIDYSYKFYQTLLSDMFTALNIDTRIQKKELSPDATKRLTRYPIRTLPLYGVSLGEYKAEGMSENDVYLIRPSEMEQRQLEHINNIALKIIEARIKLEGPSLEKFNSIQERLASKDIKIITSALIEINQILGINSFPEKLNSRTLYSKNLYDILKIVRTALGNPLPIVNEFSGYAQAFSINSVNHQISTSADFKLWSESGKYVFSKESDLMVYKLFCGKETASLDKFSFKPFGIKTEVNIISPQFDPPTVLKPSAELTEYCSHWRKTRNFYVFSENLYGQKIGNLKMSDYFIKNFNYSILGDYTNKDNAHNYEKWWIKKVRQPMDSVFKSYDLKFKELVEITRQNIFNEKTFYNWFVDHINQSKYLQKGIKENMQFETNFYLQIITRALTKEPVTPLKNKYTYLEKIVEQSKSDTFVSVLNIKTIPEIQKLQNLLNLYYLFILQDNVKFDDYVAYSKRIDTAINDILVLAGLKISSKTNPQDVAPAGDLIDFSSDDKKELTATASATGSENSDVGYKDVENLKPNFRQKAIIASVKGLRMVESEIRRFIRMKVALSQSLKLDNKEFMADFNNVNPSQNKMSSPVNASPYGQRH